MVKARSYVVIKQFEGMPKREDYEIVESELPELSSGEILVKSEYISVDPYLRAFNSWKSIPYQQFGFQVGIILESKDPNFPPGTRVVSHKGWCDHYIVNPSEPVELPEEKIYKLPNLEGLPISLGIGAVGMPGATAYFGLLKICEPKAGETVVVTGAAGGVGSLVGQIAKIKGCYVIGFAGSDDKVEWLCKDLGFDRAFNYKEVDITQALKEAAPEGVDCYFDNVGGEISSQIIMQMKRNGRISACGSISVYNMDFNKLPKATVLQLFLVFRELTVRGFVVWRWFDEWQDAFVELSRWVRSGQIKVREHITEGFDNIVDAFVGMLAGKNIGKSIVKI